MIIILMKSALSVYGFGMPGMGTPSIPKMERILNLKTSPDFSLFPSARLNFLETPPGNR
jgi:hypothetical protein